MASHVNHQHKQDAVKSLILPICYADERRTNCCEVSDATMKQI
jgi:hypothetical protein